MFYILLLIHIIDFAVMYVLTYLVIYSMTFIWDLPFPSASLEKFTVIILKSEFYNYSLKERGWGGRGCKTWLIYSQPFISSLKSCIASHVSLHASCYVSLQLVRFYFPHLQEIFGDHFWSLKCVKFSLRGKRRGWALLEDEVITFSVPVFWVLIF